VVVVVTLAIVIFASTASILSGLYSAPESFSSSGDFVIMSEGAPTMFSSRVEAGLASALMSVENVTSAWPEIVAFSTWNGRSFVIRGMDLKAYLPELVNASPSNSHLSGTAVDSITALVGTRLLDRLDMQPPTIIPITGSYASRVAIVNVVGSFESGTYLDDEMLVSLDIARHLTGTPDDMASVISVSTDNPEWLAKVLSPDTPRFVLFDVGPQAATVVRGEDFSISMSVRNWGSEEGDVTIRISEDGQLLDEHSLLVSSGSTVSVSRELTMVSVGQHSIDISVSGDFPMTATVEVSVVDPYLTVSAPSRVLVDETFTVTARTYDGQAAAGAVIGYSVGSSSGTATADSAGEVQLTLGTSGTCVLTAALEGYTAGSKSLPVIDLSTYPDEFLPVVRSFILSSDTVTEAESVVATFSIENTGALSGDVSLPLMLDSRVYSTLPVSLGPADVKTLSVRLEDLAVGTHTLQLSTFSREVVVEPWFADEPDLVQLVIRYGGSGVLSSSSSVPVYQAAKLSEGNVAVALFSIGAISGLLALLAISAVFAKEIRERRSTLGILRTIGASKSQIRRMVLPQALGYGLVGATVGVLIGAAVTVWLSRSGAFLVFGHQLSLEVDASLLVMMAVGAVAISVCSAFVSAETAVRETPIAAIKGLEPEPLPEVDIEELLGEG